MKKSLYDKGEDSTKIELRDYVAGDEVQIVKVMSTSGLLDQPDENYWRWKHLFRPGFKSWNVKIACLGRKIVGCFHYGILNVKLGSDLEVPAMFGGDYAILPECRGRRIGHQAYSLIIRNSAEHVVFQSGFSTRVVYEKFYKPMGQVLIQTVSTEYTKIFGLKPLQKKVEEFAVKITARSGLMRALRKQPVMVDLKIDNLPPCHLELTKHGLSLLEGNAQHPHLKVKVPYGILVAAMMGRRKFIISAAISLIKGKLHIDGLFRNSAKVFFLLWAAIFYRKKL